MDEKPHHSIETAHSEDISKDVPHPTMTGFDTTEENLPSGYFTSSFFIGTMYSRALYSTIQKLIFLLPG